MIDKTLPLFALSMLALSCSKKAPTPEKDPTASASAAPVTASASASAAVAPTEAPKPAIPTLVPGEPIEATKGYDFYAIEGAFILVDGLRVGRLVDDKVEWIGTLPEMNEYLGGSMIGNVTGVWPEVNVHFSALNGRAAQPSVFPLTGKGSTVRFGEGGGMGWINGVVKLGKTTLVGGYDGMGGAHFLTLRGPGLAIKPLSAEKGGCKEGEARSGWNGEEPIALPFSGVGVTGKGTLITIGNLCERSKTPAAEIWDQPGKSRIVELGHLLKEFGYFPKMLPGKGDELWIGSSPVIHYLDGKFEALPMPTHALHSMFVSPSGKLHGIANRDLVRFDDGKWTTIAKVPRGAKFNPIVMDEQGTIWVEKRGIAKLREAKEGEGDNPCKTPFVYLYDVSWKNENKYTFPTTRKALASFPDVGKIKLMEYYDWGRKLGIKVESEAQAEAVIAHVKANMKDESPELVCYEPSKPRVIEINGGK